MSNPTETLRILMKIQEVLWPEGRSEEDWSPDTLDEISSILIDNGYGPQIDYAPEYEYVEVE